jgi:hypothetical protein
LRPPSAPVVPVVLLQWSASDINYCFYYKIYWNKIFLKVCSYSPYIIDKTVLFIIYYNNLSALEVRVLYHVLMGAV